MPRLSAHIALTAGFILLGAIARAEAPTPEALEFFEKEIRPLLAETCYECHGPDKQENELRLDSHAAFQRGGLSGPLLNAANPPGSLLVQVLEYKSEIKMPPDIKLADSEVEAFRQWVVMGAPWPEEESAIPLEEAPDFATEMRRARESHWSFQPVRKPEPPVVSQPGWVRTPVDNFILARLDEEGLTPSNEADRRTLIRRLYFDLTGLPPAFEEVEAFVNDDSPTAYEDVVERLLASPHYGERWGRHWLDVARYADTKGYVFEEDRFYPYSYTYRDYVIRAFNEDLPYDRFITEQLAADHLDLSEDKRPLAALGFLTLGRRFLNNINDITDDRIDVVTRGLMGLTVSCARCHDHKYDPIGAADYYALYGIFRSSSEPGELPLIEEPDTDDPAYQEFVKILEEKQDVLADYEREQHVDMLLETREKFRAYWVAAWEALQLEDKEGFKSLAAERDLRPLVLQRWMNYLKPRLDNADAIYRAFTWFATIPEELVEIEAPLVIEKIAAATDGAEAINPLVRAAFEHAEPPKTMQDVAERYADAIETADKQWRDRLAVYSQLLIQSQSAPPDPPKQLDDPNAEALRLILYGTDSAANIPAGEVYSIAETPVQQKIRALRRDVAAHEATHDGRPDRASALVASGKPFDPWVFLRGKPENRGDAVPRRFIQVLSPEQLEPYESDGRLELARAIASPDNPLTSRVFVNRVWMHHFGQPLVGTPSDFGLRSDEPTHPELLDFLASYFIEHGWSVKDLHRLIVHSAAYRQSSAGRPDAIEKDIENRLVWRQARKRLDFESMRDSLLAVSGELDRAIGGPPRSLTDELVTTRRAVYGLVERQNMAGFIKAFDFASPDTHSPQRFETTVPQQSLFLMNSPFAVERARAFAERTADLDDSETRVREMFQSAYQREPTSDELIDVLAFVARPDFDEGPAPEPPSGWKYGYGFADTETGRIESFTEFEHFKDGKWQPLNEYPNAEFGHVALNSRGGHPGNKPEHAAILRWVAPRAGTIEISSRLRHESDQGDGVLGYIVSSREGVLAQVEVFNGFEDTPLEAIAVEAGDTIDFVAAPNTGPSHDSYKWTIDVTMDRPEDSEGESVRTLWEARSDFAGPAAEPPAPLDPWGQLAQVLLLTNEFMYVD